MKTVAEATLGASTLDLQATDEPAVDKGRLVYNGYSIEELEFAQEVITYEYVLVYRAAAGSDAEAARSTLSDQLEAIREALRSDATLLALVRAVRVPELTVQNAENGDPVGGIVIETEVIH